MSRSLFPSLIRTAAMLSLVAASVSGGAGCAAERDPINQVQPNVLSKHFFLGNDLSDGSDDPEFYWRNYVVDASVSQSMIGVGSWGGVDRVRWEVSENMLLVRKSYQIAANQDARTQIDPSGPGSVDAYGNKLVKSQQGTVVAAYRITSHFDIRRSYNSSTGEEFNVIVENASDRPWNQREYMRVDWSSNLVQNPMWEDMFFGKVFGNIKVNPLAYTVTDPRNEDAVHIDESDGYLDITNKYYLDPATNIPSPFSDLKTAPACVIVGLYTGTASYECDAQEAVVRHSYKRIDPMDDYEPLENTVANLDVIGNPGGLGSSFSIGIVTAGRSGYDPQYGYTDKLYHRFAHRHNVWQQSHQRVNNAWVGCTSNEDGDNNGTADQCENETTGYSGATGSQCDIFFKACTIPYRDRKIKTVGYWTNREAPLDLLDKVDMSGQRTEIGTLETLTASWNQLMSGALAYTREVECRRTGEGDRDQCHGEFFESDETPAGKQMVLGGSWLVDVAKDKTETVTFCHNPVRQYDLAMCGKVGETARVGDVRKNFIFYWPYDSRAPWGGIANWNADPLTGQIIGGAAQIMGRSATYAAALNRDVLQVAMGDMKLEDIITGAPAATYAKYLSNGRSPAYTQAQMDQKIHSIDVGHLKSSLGINPQTMYAKQDMLATIQRKALSVSNPMQFSSAVLEFDALAKNLKNTPFEAQVVDSSWLVNAIGASPSTPLTDSVIDQASPLRGMSPIRQHAFDDVLNANLEQRGVCFMDQHAPAVGSVLVPSLAKYFKEKYSDGKGYDAVSRGQAIYDELWKETVIGIALHEVGHSLGMLHEFASSWDAPNYHPQYWQLRTNEGKAQDSCQGAKRPGADDPKAPDTCMGPRYIDPETDDELGLGAESRPGIEYFSDTSTMEYSLERFGETAGLGAFDYHTMKALYGGIVEAYDARSILKADQPKLAWRAYTQLIERDLINENNSVTFRHYTEVGRLMKIFDLNRDCRDATEEEKAVGKWRIVHGKVCSHPPRDHWKWSDYKSDYLPGGGTIYDAPYWHAKGNDGNEYLRWFYRWGSSNNAYFHTNPSDSGADAYEVTMNTIRRFDATYPWSYFRRQNKEYYFRTLSSRISGAYFERVRAYHWQIATDVARSTLTALQDDDDSRPIAMAQNEIFNFLSRSVLMPEPGPYISSEYSADAATRKMPGSINQIYDVPSNINIPDPDFTLNIVEGRYLYEAYDNNIGGSWDYFHWLQHTGFNVEKQLATLTMVDGTPTLYTISRENAVDGRQNYINFRNDAPAGIDRMLGAIMSNDWDTVAPYVTGDFSVKNPPLQMLDISNTDASPSRPANSRLIFPNIGYRQQVETAMQVALNAKLSSDMTLINKMRIWIDGQVGGITIPDAQQVRFTDPNSGYTYIARKWGTETVAGKVIDKGIASRMIQAANAIEGSVYQVTKSGGKPVLDAYGRPTLILDSNGMPQLATDTDAKLESDLVKYVGLLDAVKQIEAILGFGPLDKFEGE